jgi:glycosyltransferase involved in cell wall biosynthesis
MKRIGIFLTADPSNGGMFQYSQAVLSAILALPRGEFSVIVAYLDPVWTQYIEEPAMLSLQINPSMAMNAIGRLWATLGMSLKLWRMCFSRLDSALKSLVQQNCDLWIFPVQDFWPTQFPVPMIAAVHDLMHRYESRFPEVSAHGRFRFRETYLSDICKQARGLLVDSELGKAQVHESYGVPVKKIFVLPYVIPDYLRDYQATSDFASRYTLPHRYLFYPSQFWQHKNHMGLIRAIAKVKEKFPDVHAVFAGSKTREYPRILSAVESLGLQGNVTFLGYVPDRDMPELYRRARALVMPTFFGPTNIPPLEAFVLGCPVAVSRIYAMPEQVGDAALLFDPNSTEEMASCIGQLWSDGLLCRKLIEEGWKKVDFWGPDKFNAAFRDIVAALMDQVAAEHVAAQ